MTENQFPIGQRVSLTGHFGEPVVLEAVQRYVAQGKLRSDRPTQADILRIRAILANCRRITKSRSVTGSLGYSEVRARCETHGGSMEVQAACSVRARSPAALSRWKPVRHRPGSVSGSAT
jgi:hypothetical protein